MRHDIACDDSPRWEWILDCSTAAASTSALASVTLGTSPIPTDDVQDAAEHAWATALLDAAERAALAAGRDILVLDTEEHGAAHRLYLRAGWTLLGTIPGATLRGDGTPCANAVFWKRLRP